jgi:hypothetical protein
LELNLSCCGIACLRNGSTVDNILKEHQTLHEMRWMAELVPRLLATASFLGLKPDISQKYKMIDISKRVANTL